MATKSGFSAVEAMIALLVAAIFVTAGFQLHGLVLGSASRINAQLKASNIAYSHLRYQSSQLDSAVCIPAPISKVLTPTDEENSSLRQLKIRSKSSMPYGCEGGIIRFEVEVEYYFNGSTKREKQVIYVDK